MKIDLINYENQDQLENKKIIRQSLIVGCIITLLVLILSFFIENLNYTCSIGYLIGFVVSIIAFTLTCKSIENVANGYIRKKIRFSSLIKRGLYIGTLIIALFLFNKNVIVYMFVVFGLLHTKYFVIIKELFKRKKS